MSCRRLRERWGLAGPQRPLSVSTRTRALPDAPSEGRLFKGEERLAVLRV
ncbi:hypothetical protein [Streptomyces sp. NBC_00267]|nr:hypothetical protein [Streptomyces sp. NBC_00267]